MANAINSSASRFHAAQCLLMSKFVSRMVFQTKEVFWETLPDSIPDLTAHLPALTEAVKNETNPDLLVTLSFFPLPAILSPELANWRQELINAWEKQLHAAREAPGKENDLSSVRSVWNDRYISSLRGLIQVEQCGLLPATTCPSLLPALLNEAHDVQKRFVATVATREPADSPEYLECLSILAGWRPARNVIAAPATLKAWADFWLELYHRTEACQKGDKKQDNVIILKGITAKALLNLLEVGDQHETGIPVGMETVLLECLTTAAESTMRADLTQRSMEYAPRLHLLSWQPRDVVRFPTDRLAMFPKVLLEKFRLWCQKPWMYGYKIQQEKRRPVHGPLEELIRWDRAGLLAACDIDLLPSVITDLSDCLNQCVSHMVPSANYMSHQLYRWLIRDEVADLKEGKELLQKLETHWQFECNLKCHDSYSKSIAWKARMELQRAGLATETPVTFQKSLLKAIEEEQCPEVRVVLSLWNPEKDIPDRMQKTLKHVWRERLRLTGNPYFVRIDTLALLRPNPTDNLIVQRWEVLDILSALPEALRPELSIAEITHLMGELPMGNPHAVSNPVLNQTWQFRPEETRFRIPAEPATPVSTPANVQTPRPDKTVQRTVGVNRNLMDIADDRPYRFL